MAPAIGYLAVVLEVLLVGPGPATLLPGFGHPNKSLAGAASPGEGGGESGVRGGCAPNRRCQAVVGGEPSASAQPARADTARHRWPGWGWGGGLPSYQIKPSKHDVTPSILEGTFPDPAPRCLRLHVPSRSRNGCFPSSWDRCLWGSLISWEATFPLS